MRRIFVSILIASLTIGMAPRQDLPSVTESHGGFAFANLDGTELIVLHDIPHAADLRTAICAGQSRSVRFVRRQTGAGMPPADRESPKQFDRLKGTVFEVLGRPIPSNHTCFVAANSLIENAEVYSVQALARPTGCTAAERRRAAALRERPVRACWSIATTPRLGAVVIAEYARRQRDALASLIVITDDGPIVIDFPATYTRDGEPLWRVDDGGEFSPDGFSVPLIVRRGRLYGIAVDWHGEEGNSLNLYTASPGASAQKVLSDYWYRAPH